MGRTVSNGAGVGNKRPPPPGQPSPSCRGRTASRCPAGRCNRGAAGTPSSSAGGHPGSPTPVTHSHAPVIPSHAPVTPSHAPVTHSHTAVTPTHAPVTPSYAPAMPVISLVLGPTAREHEHIAEHHRRAEEGGPQRHMWGGKGGRGLCCEAKGARGGLPGVSQLSFYFN